MKKFIRPIAAGLLLTGLLPTAAAAPLFSGATLNIGGGLNSDTDDAVFFRLGLTSGWEKQWASSGSWQFSLAGEVSLGHWKGHSADRATLRGASSIQTVGAGPVIRYARQPLSQGPSPFVEYGLGLVALSDDVLRNERPQGRDFGGQLQFENRLSAGVRFGARHQYEAGLSYFHYSNGDTEAPNQGIDFLSAILGYRF